MVILIQCKDRVDLVTDIAGVLSNIKISPHRRMVGCCI